MASHAPAGRTIQRSDATSLGQQQARAAPGRASNLNERAQAIQLKSVDRYQSRRSRCQVFRQSRPTRRSLSHRRRRSLRRCDYDG